MTIQERALRRGGPRSRALGEISSLRGRVTDVPTASGAMDESELIHRAMGGDRDAFGALFRRDYTSVYRLARFYVEGAEELAAQTFTRAWAQLPTFPAGTPFATWLYEIAGEVVADARTDKLRAAFRDLVPELTDQDDDDMRALIAPLVALLPEGQRELIEMKYLLGMSDPEVAACFKKSIDGVDELRWQAIISMKALMERER